MNNILVWGVDFGRKEFEISTSWVRIPWTKQLTQSFTEEKKGFDFSPRSGEATSGEK